MSYMEIGELTSDLVGRWVEYTPAAGEKERGRIKSWNRLFVFVVFKCHNQWERFRDFTAAAVEPRELTLLPHDYEPTECRPV